MAGNTTRGRPRAAASTGIESRKNRSRPTAVRGSFFGTADVGVGISVGMTFLFLLLCLGGVVWIFRTGYKLKA